MMTFFAVFALMAIVVAGMSVGVIFGRKPIKGSCGGVGAALGEKEYTCPVCGDDPNLCDQSESASASASESLGYEIKQ